MPRYYTTGTGQRIGPVHLKRQCKGQPCVIHNPTNHHMREWPTHWRGDRRIMERLCPHGVGHPDPDCVYAQRDPIHGCDGCCNPKYHTTTTRASTPENNNDG